MSAEAQVIERFQLTFLQHLSAHLPDGWCIKGGVNIRAFYASPRSSKDIDFDAFLRHDRLQERVSKILRSSTFEADLRRTEIELVDLHPSKDTHTTVRWKPELLHQRRLRTNTKLEFSLRGLDESDDEIAWLQAHMRTDSVDEALRLRHSLAVAPTATHYDATAAYEQKVQALALRSDTKARDVFDMNWLLAHHPEACTQAPAKNAQLAAERAVSLGYDDFSAQVVPFLDRDDAAIYGTKRAWDQMLGHVVEDLLARADVTIATKEVS
jgi:predicted nucleotidyltransferase component of viral defense system